MANSESYDIQNDSDLTTAVRSETQYDDGVLSPSDLDELIKSAKRVLSLKADVTQFYDDRGIAVALFGITCAKAKGSVENSPVKVKNLGAEDVTFRTSDGESLQLEQYESMTEMALAESAKTNAGVRRLEVTRDWLHD